MLIEIVCDKFREGAIQFGTGLNVVLGDDKATNSIGKSTLLKVVDFAFGGDILLTHSKDVVEELGEHSYSFSFKFDKVYKFYRSTDKNEDVWLLNDVNDFVSVMTLKEFTDFLKTKYTENLEGMSFRELVSLVSRVWGKLNREPSRPLHIVPAQNSTVCVEYLIKLYGYFSQIAQLNLEIAELKEERGAITKAFSKNIIPKISKKQHKENVEKIDGALQKIEKIKEELAVFAISLNELISDAVLEAKAEKNALLNVKMELNSQLIRVRSNLDANSKASAKSFEPLQKIIPELNVEKLLEIELFHSELARILKAEIKRQEKVLLEKIKAIDLEVSEADQKIAAALGSVDKPSFIVDSVCDLSLELTNLKRENYYHESEASLKGLISEHNAELEERKVQILSSIQSSINSRIREIVDFIYSPQRKAPVLTLAPHSYTYEVVRDTGTGTAFSSLVIFDIALLETTQLPFVIHDSHLFANIEDDALANLLSRYDSENKQCFIAFDALKKYSANTQAIVHKNKVLQLDDENLLYVKDWRKANK